MIRGKKRTRISYIVRDYSEACPTRHCFGVNALALTSDRTTLYSAGRDSTIRSWDVSNEANPPVHLRSLEHHTDWVNDIFLCDNDSTLVSCSSDTTVKLWNTRDGTCLNTLSRHQDYVKCLAYAPDARIFASGGLDSAIYLYDLESARHTTSFSIAPSSSSSATTTSSSDDTAPATSSPHPLRGQKESVYSLAVDRRGTILLAGSTDRVLRAWDPRSGRKLFKLRGHHDNVKAVVVSDDGRHCLSGASDASLKLWDLRAQRCLHTLNVHDDSVWALAVTPNAAAIGAVVSGGRDRHVYYTDIAAATASANPEKESVLVCTENAPVLRIVVADNGDLWITTTSPAIKKWSLQCTVMHKPEHRKRMLRSHSLTSSSTSNATVSTVSASASTATARVSTATPPQPAQTAPRVVIEGRPGIVQCQILNNRRHVLSKDDSGRVQLWDITRAAKVADIGTDSATQPSLFDEEVKRRFELISIPNWFTLDTKTGSIMVHLDEIQCFNALSYASAAGIAAPSPPVVMATGASAINTAPESVGDSRINMGECILRALFRRWREARLRMLAKEEEEVANDDAKVDKREAKERGSAKDGKDRKGKEADGFVPPTARELLERPSYRFELAASEDDVIVVVSEDGATLYRKPIAAFDGTEYLPNWAVDALLERRELRDQFNFYVEPYDADTDGRDLPRLPHAGSKLTASRLLKVARVAQHVVALLKLELPPVNAADDNAVATAETKRVAPEEYIEILCHEDVLPPNIDLATVKTFYWKSGDDLVLRYRRAEKFKPNRDASKKQKKGAQQPAANKK